MKPDFPSHSIACFAASSKRSRTTSIGERLCEASIGLEGKFQFSGRLHVVDYIDELGTSRQIPVEERFADEDAYSEAVQQWEWSMKPWSLVTTASHTSIAKHLTTRVQWGVNSRRYTYHQRGALTRILFPHHIPQWDPPKAQQDAHHDRLVRRFIENVVRVVGDNAEFYDASHMLDLESVDRDSHDWSCFFDETLACVGNSAIVMIWLGHIRYYG